MKFPQMSFTRTINAQHILMVIKATCCSFHRISGRQKIKKKNAKCLSFFFVHANRPCWTSDIHHLIAFNFCLWLAKLNINFECHFGLEKKMCTYGWHRWSSSLSAIINVNNKMSGTWIFDSFFFFYKYEIWCKIIRKLMNLITSGKTNLKQKTK